MERFIETVLDGITTGSIYGALALALVLIFRSTGIVNFAQGELATLSTFVAWGLTEAGVGIAPAILITLVLSFIGGLLLERTVIRPVEGKSELTIVVVTLGLFILVNGLMRWIWGPENRGVERVFPDDAVAIGSVETSVEALGIVCVLLIVAAALYLIFQKTTLGLTMRAAAANPEESRLVAIPTGRMLMLGWGMAAVCGAIAGVLVAPTLFLDPNMMAPVMIYAFAAAVLGGFDSPFGAILGGWIIGVSENLAGSYVGFVGQDLKIVVPLAIIVAVLLTRPQGLFGTPQVARV
jgi:branched-chain amino acid transport system permease protein